MSGRRTGVVGLALGVFLLAEEGWDSVDIVLEAGGSAVTAGTVDDESVLLRIIISLCSTEREMGDKQSRSHS